jgi:predicted enzyme related to lactoylglutathione lyase
MADSDIPAGAPCWIDLMAGDVERSQYFYTQLFGWEAGVGSPEFGGYFMYLKDGAPVAGGMPTPPGTDLPDTWGIYLSVGDARKTVETALAQGATVRSEPIDVADLGTSAVIDDPTGARIGVWQPNTFSGFAVTATPGAPGWFELLALDYPTAVGFYRDVLGWDAHPVSDTPEFRYTTLGADRDARAGIMDASGFPDEPSAGAWSVYFATEDTDASLDRVTELGGSVVRPAEDTPYGRLATANDPGGARFKLLGRNQGA